MLSAIKKLTTRQDTPTTNQTAGTCQPNTPCIPMSGSLQKRFAKGVQYNSRFSIYFAPYPNTTKRKECLTFN